MTLPHRLLAFRCTGCGNCCKDPILPLTDADVRRIVDAVGDAPEDFVRFVSGDVIDMEERDAYAVLRGGRRVMTLRRERGACRYLGRDDRCTIYEHRPLGCRVFPFDPTFRKRDGALVRLRLIDTTQCDYALDGHNAAGPLRQLSERYDGQTARWYERVAEWNAAQRARKRMGRAAQTTRELLAFVMSTPTRPARRAPH